MKWILKKLQGYKINRIVINGNDSDLSFDMRSGEHNSVLINFWEKILNNNAKGDDYNSYTSQFIIDNANLSTYENELHAKFLASACLWLADKVGTLNLDSGGNRLEFTVSQEETTGAKFLRYRFEKNSP